MAYGDCLTEHRKVLILIENFTLILFKTLKTFFLLKIKNKDFLFYKYWISSSVQLIREHTDFGNKVQFSSIEMWIYSLDMAYGDCFKAIWNVWISKNNLISSFVKQNIKKLKVVF